MFDQNTLVKVVLKQDTLYKAGGIALIVVGFFLLFLCISIGAFSDGVTKYHYPREMYASNMTPAGVATGLGNAGGLCFVAGAILLHASFTKQADSTETKPASPNKVEPEKNLPTVVPAIPPEVGPRFQPSSADSPSEYVRPADTP